MDRLDDGREHTTSPRCSTFRASTTSPTSYTEKTQRYKLPQGFLLGSETASTVSSRGVYKFPVVPGKQVKYPDNQSSSYDLEACSLVADAGRGICEAG